MKRQRFVPYIIVLLLLTSLLAGCSGTIITPETAKARAGGEALGIKVEAIRLTAANYMLDFRYRVLDRDKAMPLFRPEIQPILVHEKSGARFAVPVPAKVGALRQTSMTPEVGRGYFALFANPGQYVKAGDRVSIEVGDFRLNNLIVE